MIGMLLYLLHVGELEYREGAIYRPGGGELMIPEVEEEIRRAMDARELDDAGKG